jgi:hypothetical protein
VLKFLYLEANTGAKAEVEFFDQTKAALNCNLCKYGCNLMKSLLVVEARRAPQGLLFFGGPTGRGAVSKLGRTFVLYGYHTNACNVLEQICFLT